MSILQAIIQGIARDATEFLPISNSGHPSLVQHFMGVKVDNPLLDVMLHIGVLLAILIVCRELILRLIVALIHLMRDVFTGKLHWSYMNADRRLPVILMIGLLLLFLLFVPVPSTGHQVRDSADLWAADSDIVVEGYTLVMTSILLTLDILTTKRQRSRGRVGAISGRRSFGVLDALAAGFAQCMAAVFPGLSRSGPTLSVRLMRGISRQMALDYSFVIGIPAIVAAAALELKDALHEPVTIGIAPILAGVITAAIVGFLVTKLLHWMVASDKLMILIWYALTLGIAIIVIGVFEHQTGWIVTFPS